MPSPTLWCVVLGLDQRQRDVGLVVEDVVGPLGLAAADQLAAHDDAALGEADLLARSAAISSQPALRRAGVMNLVQISRSLRVRLSTEWHTVCQPSQRKASILVGSAVL